MTKTYSQIVKQIEALKGEAEKARRKEIDGVIGRIREAIDVYALTAEDLGLGGKVAAGAKAAKGPGGAGRKAAKTPKADKTVRPAKYSNGTGGTWGGRGKRPQWLRDALAGGKTLEEFAVK